jgi:uncharacterized protein
MERLIEFSNRAGRRLRGMIHEPGTGAPGTAPGVVFFHGFTGDRMESHWLFVKCSRALARAGLASLRFDFSGSGESEGDFAEADLESEMADAEDAVGFFRRQGCADPHRIGLLGLSLGGAVAALVAPRVQAKALMMLAAPSRLPHLRALAETFSTPLPGANGFREYAGHRVSMRFLEAADRIDPTAGVAAFTGPTLIVHPERDEYLPLNHPEEYLRASAGVVREKVIIAGADHTFTSVAWECEVIDRTVTWFCAHL